MRQVLLEALPAACREQWDERGQNGHGCSANGVPALPRDPCTVQVTAGTLGFTEQQREDLKNTTADDIHLYFPKLEKTVHPSLENKNKTKEINAAFWQRELMNARRVTDHQRALHNLLHLL